MDMEPHQNAVPPEPRHDTSAVSARQGVISGRVLLVLLTSMLLAIIVLAVGYWAVR